MLKPIEALVPLEQLYDIVETVLLPGFSWLHARSVACSNTV